MAAVGRFGSGLLAAALVVAAVRTAGAAESGDGASPAPAELVEKLGAESWAEREKAHNALAALGTGAVAELGKALRSPDAEVFWRALAILSSVGPAAKETLERAAQDDGIANERRQRIEKALEALDGAGYLGVYISGGTFEAPGGKAQEPAVSVVGVIDRSPAERAGMKTGDTITEVDGERVRSPEELTAEVQKRKVGTKVKVAFVRDGRVREVEILLAARPAVLGNE